MATSTIPFAKDYTLEQIDQYLVSISNIILHGKRTDKKKAFARVDEWLDMRLELTKGGE